MRSYKSPYGYVGRLAIRKEILPEAVLQFEVLERPFFWQLLFLLLILPVLCNAQVQPHFTDATREAGLGWRNWYGNNNANTILETTGSGAAFFDYDDDGYLDLYVVNGALGFEGPRLRNLPRDVAPPASGKEPRNALFHNRGDATFTDATASSGTGHTGWGAGCVVGDYDNDGDRDLYLTYYGPNVLYRNEGGGKFVDLSAEAGVDDRRYGTACAFGDYDNDGDLDLFVGNYVAFDPQTTLLPGERRGNDFGGQRGVASVASPEIFEAQSDVLYRNEGDGSFVDVSGVVGLNARPGKALGALFWDWNNDGDLDLYVANDATPNLLYTNRGNATFVEEGLRLGVAYDAEGRLEGSMGVAAGDWDNDGDEDLVVSNYEGQTATLHRNDSTSFSNISFVSGVGSSTLMPLQWGTVLFDYDRDGDEDLFIANGHVTAALEDYFPQSSYGQKNQLFRNDGGVFKDITAQAGPGLQLVRSSRGSAAGDYDNDGDEDLFVVDKNDLPALLRNDTRSIHNWLMVRTRGSESNRDGIGARIRIRTGTQEQTRKVRAGSSYLSHNSLWVAFGLGESAVVDTLEIGWPGGRVDQFADVQGNRFVVVEEGGAIRPGPR